VSVGDENNSEGTIDNVRVGTFEADEGILRQINELELGQARQIGGEVSQRRLGALSIESLSTNFSAPGGQGLRIGSRVVHHNLVSRGDALRLDDVGPEWDASVEFEKRFGRDRLRARGGGSFRNDDSLPYGQIVWEPRWSNQTRGRFELYLNEISEDSPALRVIGAKHKVSGEFTAELTARESATVRLTGQGYHTRNYDRLAEGMRLEALATSVLVRGSPFVQVRAYGSWQKNHLADRLVGSLARSVLPANATVSSVIAPDHRALGVGGLLRTGQNERRPQAYIDGWAGATWPNQQFGFQWRAGVSTPIFGADVLVLEGFYTNAPAASPGEVYRGLQVRYQRLF